MNWPLLTNSLLVAGLATALAMTFGFAAALWLAGLAPRWRKLFLTLAVIALALPPFLVVNCWLDLLGDAGKWQTWFPLQIHSPGGAVWILSLMFWPITLFAVLAAWRRLDVAQLEADPAVTGWTLIRTLLIPVVRGELALAAVLTFVLALNNFAVPTILQVKVFPEEMWVKFNTEFDTAGTLKLGWPLVFAPLLLLALLLRRGVEWPRIQGAISAKAFRRQLGSFWVTCGGAIAILICIASVAVPLGQIALTHRTWMELKGAAVASRGAIWNSFWYATLAATVVLAAALCFGRSRREEAQSFQSSFSQRLLTSSPTNLLAWLPFLLPGVLLGIVLIWIFNRPLFAALYPGAGVVVLAFSIRYFALGWMAAGHALRSADRDLMDVARIEGATRWQLFRHALWPQIAPQVAAAWYVVFLLCLWDVESMILIVPPGGETLALRIFNLLHFGHNAQVNALCLALLGVAVLPLALVAVFVRTRQMFAGRSGKDFSRALTSAATFLGLATLLSSCSPPSLSNEAPVKSRIFSGVEVFGHRGVGIGEFNKPRSVAVDKQDNFYVVDMTGRVQKFSPDGKFLLLWQMPQTDLGKPKGMCRDADGNIVVVEPHYSRVNHFSPDGKLVAQWGERGTNAGQFSLPRAAVVNSRGEIWVSEYTTAERVQRFALKSEGGAPRSPNPSESQGVAEIRPPKLLSVLGKPGTAPGEFNRAEGVGVDKQDRLYVADSCNHRVQVFSPDGKFLRESGKAGSGPGEFSYPYDVCVDAQGFLFVCEFGNSRIQVFDQNGKFVEIIGGPGAEPGRFANPWGMALDSRGNLYVADSQNHRVQKLIRKGAIANRQSPIADTSAQLIASLRAPHFALRTSK